VGGRPKRKLNAKDKYFSTLKLYASKSQTKENAYGRTRGSLDECQDKGDNCHREPEKNPQGRSRSNPQESHAKPHPKSHFGFKKMEFEEGSMHERAPSIQLV
jgi:hypothetical protein